MADHMAIEYTDGAVSYTLEVLSNGTMSKLPTGSTGTFEHLWNNDVIRKSYRINPEIENYIPQACSSFLNMSKHISYGDNWKYTAALMPCDLYRYICPTDWHYSTNCVGATLAIIAHAQWLSNGKKGGMVITPDHIDQRAAGRELSTCRRVENFLPSHSITLLIKRGIIVPNSGSAYLSSIPLLTIRRDLTQ
tara:strand:+ start:1853 stop:2428 length:576 start_codon:yes stop_codon:yes gene_type:complete